MHGATPTFTLLASAVLLSGCATLATPRCSIGEQAAIHDQLYFGTTRKDAPITPDEWATFVAETVTTKLPDGFTVWDATGQWREGGGRIVKEAVHVLSVAHADDARSEQVVQDIASAYRARFDQHGVFRIRAVACIRDLQGQP